MCVFKAIYKKAFPIPPLDSFDSYLIISPHPDDSDVAAGGLISKLVRLGKTVTVANLTDGRFGDMDVYRPDELIKIRQEEEKNAKAVYGKVETAFMNFSDGGKYDEINAAEEIAKLIVKYKPDVVMAPDFHLASECHPDHLKTGRAAAYANIIASDQGMMTELGVFSKHAVKEIAFYYTDKPNRRIKIEKQDLKNQIAAMSCHKSQFKESELKDFEKFFKIRAIRSGLKIGTRYAESYRVLTSFMTHCIPEASEL